MEEKTDDNLTKILKRATVCLALTFGIVSVGTDIYRGKKTVDAIENLMPTDNMRILLYILNWQIQRWDENSPYNPARILYGARIERLRDHAIRQATSFVMNGIQELVISNNLSYSRIFFQDEYRRLAISFSDHQAGRDLQFMYVSYYRMHLHQLADNLERASQSNTLADAVQTVDQLGNYRINPYNTAENSIFIEQTLRRYSGPVFAEAARQSYNEIISDLDRHVDVEESRMDTLQHFVFRAGSSQAAGLLDSDIEALELRIDIVNADREWRSVQENLICPNLTNAALILSRLEDRIERRGFETLNINATQFVDAQRIMDINSNPGNADMPPRCKLSSFRPR